MTKRASDYRAGSKRNMIARLAERGLSKREAYNELRGMVESQISPMIFQANIGGSRTPKPMADQLVELKNEIGRVYAEMGRSISKDFDSPETPQTPEPKPEPKGENESAVLEFRRRIRELRAFCVQRERLSETLDSIGLRPAEHGIKLIRSGIPVEALLDTCTMHWPDDARRENGIRKFDFVALSKRILRDRGITEITRTDEDGETYTEPAHEMFGYVLVLVENRIPVFLTGPAGSGKSHLARQMADYLGLNYGETPMSPGATRGDLLGRHTVGGFIASNFNELYGNGGIFNFEEIDASDAAMLLVCNNALAGKRLYNSNSGEMVKRSGDFVAMATANTLGMGANRVYGARERLDFATIDRWRMGRVFIGFDERVEDFILGL